MADEAAPDAERAVGALDDQRESQPEVIPREVSRQLQRLGDEVGRMADAMRGFAGAGKEREKLIEALTQENRCLRAGESERAVIPAVRELIRLYDDLQSAADRAHSRTEYAARAFAEELESFRDAVVDALYRQGCEPYSTEIGSGFDAKEHDPIHVIATTEAARDCRIARLVKTGFRFNGRILRTAQTAVFRYQASSVIPEAPNEPESTPAPGEIVESAQTGAHQ